MGKANLKLLLAINIPKDIRLAEAISCWS